MFQLEIKIELKYSEISNKIRETSIDTISYSKGLLKSCLSFLTGLIMKIPCKACFLINVYQSIFINIYVQDLSWFAMVDYFYPKSCVVFFYPNMGNTHEILNVLAFIVSTPHRQAQSNLIPIISAHKQFMYHVTC